MTHSNVHNNTLLWFTEISVPRTRNRNLNKKDFILNMATGIAGESGEIIDHLKKHFFQGHDLDTNHIQEEIGDLMYYIAGLTKELGLDLETILELNDAKLRLRYPKGFTSEASIKRRDKNV